MGTLIHGNFSQELFVDGTKYMEGVYGTSILAVKSSCFAREVSAQIVELFSDSVCCGVLPFKISDLISIKGSSCYSSLPNFSL